MKKKIFLLGIVCVGFVALGPRTVHAADICKCSGTVSAGTFLPDKTFDSYCSSMASYCPSCGKGKASCKIEFTASKEECDKASSDPFSIASSKFGVAEIAETLLNVTISCSFTASKDATDKTLAKATSSTPTVKTTSSSLPPLFEKRNLQDPLGNITIEALIGRIISGVLPLVGALFLLLFVWGGFQYLTAGGDSKKVESATKTLTGAVIGICIVVGAYIIVSTFLTIFAGGAPPVPKK